ncbi:hypothetical protein LOH54_05800 [Sulfurimonas sp. HSL-3221]|uniref:hypothetical protein n=1 Tax=Thiomicrolovo sulfuroxydans TaxID=2894755 RepID=UPI001E5FE59D|nr:hypothetical protein [Sulfurimonas sp. HSL-3221]UFS63644.1 hypothetical protein LOH54_05800 [Sulfurimonas sp. HSL-3221]
MIRAWHGRMPKMKVVFVTVALFFAGCGSKQPEPAPAPSTMTIDGQKLLIPEAMRGRVMTRVKPVTYYSLARNDNLLPHFSYSNDDNHISFKKASERPRYTLDFGGRYIVRELYVEPSGGLYWKEGDMIKDLIRLPLSYALDPLFVHQMIDVDIAAAGQTLPRHLALDSREEVALGFTSLRPLSKVDISVKSLYNTQTVRRGREYHLAPDTFHAELLRPEDFEAMARYTLVNRPAPHENESLVLMLCRHDRANFARLKRQRRSFTLPSFSMLDLPDDVDVAYAVGNMAKIARSNQYKTNRGQIRVIRSDSFYSVGKGRVAGGEEFKVRSGGKKMTVRHEAPTAGNEEFIDFDGGLE